MILERLRQRAAADLQHIVLPEGDDPRTVVAAAMCAQQKIARITLLGSEEKIRTAAASAGANLGGVEVIDHRKASDFEKMADFYHELRRAKGMMPDEARLALADPLYYGNLMVRMGRADGSVAGATNTTRTRSRRAPLHRRCAQVFRSSPSFFVMALRDEKSGTKAR